MQRAQFRDARPRRAILEDYRQVLERIYDPVRFCARVKRLIARLKWSRQPRRCHPGDMRRPHGIEAVQRLVDQVPEWRDLLWDTFVRCYRINPRAVRQTVSLLAFFLHLGPYARHVARETERAIAAIDAGTFTPPPLVPPARSMKPLAISARENARAAGQWPV